MMSTTKSAMLVFVVIVGMTPAFAQTQAAQAMDERNFRLGKMSITEVQSEEYNLSARTLNNLDALGAAGCVDKNLQAQRTGVDLIGFVSGVGEVAVVVDEIINIGQKIWDIIAKSKPVVNVQLESASALPRGATCWIDLDSWSAPQSKVYSVKYDNLLGITVVDFRFRITYVYGGSYKGTGKYLANASVLPAYLNVRPGFDFDVKAEVPVVYNQGSVANPLAALQLNLKWNIKSILEDTQQTESFFINGNGAFQKLQ